MTFFILLKCQLPRTIDNTKTKLKKKTFLSRNFVLLSITLISFQNSISKSLCSVGSGFQRTIHDTSKFFQVLLIFNTIEMKVHIKQQSVLSLRCKYSFDLNFIQVLNSVWLYSLVFICFIGTIAQISLLFHVVNSISSKDIFN